MRYYGCNCDRGLKFLKKQRTFGIPAIAVEEMPRKPLIFLKTVIKIGINLNAVHFDSCLHHFEREKNAVSCDKWNRVSWRKFCVEVYRLNLKKKRWIVNRHSPRSAILRYNTRVS